MKVECLGDGKWCTHEIRVLNKVLRHTKEGIEMEADPRHAEMISRELSLEQANISSVPGTKATRHQPSSERGHRQSQTEDDGETTDDDEEMEPREATKYRAIAARLNYLVVDRADLQLSMKEAARAMSNPKKGQLEQIRRIGRYLLASRDLSCASPGRRRHPT